MATAEEQIARLVEGFAESGFILVERSDLSARPARLSLLQGDERRDLRVFCWNVTHGGHGRSATEYRVQTTRPGDVQFYDPEAETLVLGYDELRDVFAAWDARKHLDPSSSASLQIPMETLERGRTLGFAARDRPLQGTEVEIVVAFRPELVGDYLNVLPNLDASDAVLGRAIAAAASGEVAQIQELPADVERRRAVTLVSRAVRNSQFRLRVLGAYDHRCAFCGLGARLAHAAHIDPIDQGGQDQVRNGIVACPTHHSAFDSGLLVVEDDLQIRLNESRLREVGADELDRATLAAGIYERLRVPSDPELQPEASNLAARRALLPAG